MRHLCPVKRIASAAWMPKSSKCKREPISAVPSFFGRFHRHYAGKVCRLSAWGSRGRGPGHTPKGKPENVPRLQHGPAGRGQEDRGSRRTSHSWASAQASTVTVRWTSLPGEWEAVAGGQPLPDDRRPTKRGRRGCRLAARLRNRVAPRAQQGWAPNSPTRSRCPRRLLSPGAPAVSFGRETAK